MKIPSHINRNAMEKNQNDNRNQNTDNKSKKSSKQEEKKIKRPSLTNQVKSKVNRMFVNKTKVQHQNQSEVLLMLWNQYTMPN